MARKALGPATLQVVQAVRAMAERPIVAAVSGGGDSLALAFAVAEVARKLGLDHSAVTVDHGLQAGSAERARLVQDQLLRFGYPDVVLRRVELTPDAGPEADARTARYRVLEAEAAERNADLFLGHTLDDQAETVLLGLARGSGVRSLAGMAPRSGRRVRPLLGVHRATTQACCVELGLEVWNDPHNSDPRFTRSRLRQRVLPSLENDLGPGVAEALARTAELARADADLLDRLAEELHAAATAGPQPPNLEVINDEVPSANRGSRKVPVGPALNCPILAAAEPALRGRVIKRWLLDCGARDIALQHVRAVESLIIDWHGQRQVQLPGMTVCRRAGDLLASAAGSTPRR
ncbi:tRNA lysidine(34) synthetase TilS [Microlunatus elymi]|uniref:tRNA(Ile)-lysidine synthase n=1 Tax=Microlunatus elymi TaxID=2596828 RepID=A0A516PVP2_9ACTN|nr:tRNA lysidine(34) synthetase TilS [Microlunatus elymi]QDP95192.1 tRNA lysidine(34) synthetase TilS [Microlunatus elymi]